MLSDAALFYVFWSAKFFTKCKFIVTFTCHEVLRDSQDEILIVRCKITGNELLIVIYKLL